MRWPWEQQHRDRKKEESYSPSGLETANHRGSFLESLHSELTQQQHPCIVDACNWYTRYLTCQFNASNATWTSIFSKAWESSANSGDCVTQESGSDLTIFFKCAKLIANGLSNDETALITIVDDLYNDNDLPFVALGNEYNMDGKDDDNDLLDLEGSTGRVAAQQMTFAIMGWISRCSGSRYVKSFLIRLDLLYQAKPMKLPEMANFVEIREAYKDIESSTAASGRSLYGQGKRSFLRNRRTRGSVSYRRNLEDRDQSLDVFLSFGKIIPDDLKDSLLRQFSDSTKTLLPELIELSNVCYHSLNKLADIRIRWVHDLTAHLQFHSRTRILNVFQYPSACLVLDSAGEKTLLSRSV